MGRNYSANPLFIFYCFIVTIDETRSSFLPDHLIQSKPPLNLPVKRNTYSSDAHCYTIAIVKLSIRCHLLRRKNQNIFPLHRKIIRTFPHPSDLMIAFIQYGNKLPVPKIGTLVLQNLSAAILCSIGYYHFNSIILHIRKKQIRILP